MGNQWSTGAVLNAPMNNEYSIAPYLQVNHVLGVRGLHIAGRTWLNAGLLQLVEQEPQLPLHLLTPPHLIDELALECTHVGVQL